MDILKETYPDAQYYLNFNSPLQLLVAAILSARTRDKVVNEVTENLFKKYETPEDYARSDLANLRSEISKISFSKNKAKYIKKSAQILRDEYDGQVPQTIDELTELPGVGQKTANVILTNAFGKVFGIVVDTHVIRLSYRLGLTEEEKNANKIEKDLEEIVPKSYWKILPWIFKDHGRAICTAQNLRCGDCVVEEYCPALTLHESSIA